MKPSIIQTEMYFQFGPGPYKPEQFPEIIEAMGDFVEGLRKAYLNTGNQEKVLEYKTKAEEYRRRLNQANKRIEELENKLSEYTSIEQAHEFNRFIYLEDLSSIRELVDSLIAEFSPNTKQEKQNGNQ